MQRGVTVNDEANNTITSDKKRVQQKQELMSTLEQQQQEHINETIEQAQLQVQETEELLLHQAATLRTATMLHRSSGRNLFAKLLPCIYKK